MAKINYDFYDGNDIYNDGDVEEKLLKFYKEKNANLNLYDDGVFYLTTDVRGNILNWFPFSKNDEVLEIGCGCGTITEVLCNKCKNVTSIDGSKRRAEITYYRHQSKKNLEVFVGNFDKIVLEKKFNYIILNGVFEYSKIFFDVDNPFDYFLDKMKDLLKKNGKILIAIENRYGIKYWAGCNEDHLYQPYVGLEGYDYTNIQTFGKQEFIDLIKRHGFNQYKFYYPFPDYKLPSIIYSDERLPKKSELNDLPIYLYGGMSNFNILKVLSGIIDNNLFGEFSNSFLVEFGGEEAIMSDVVYAKNLSYRNLKYKTLTIENGCHEIFKVSDNNSGILHLKRMQKIHEELKKNNIDVCDIFNRNDKFYMEYISGKSISDKVIKLAEDNHWNEVELEIDKFIKFYYSISKLKKLSKSSDKFFQEIYGQEKTYIMKVPIIDGNISNIIIDDNNRYVFIDQEWSYDGDLPAEYLIYFSLLYLFNINEKLSSHFTMNYFLKKYKINIRKIEGFKKFEQNYYSEVIDIQKKKILDGCKGGDATVTGQAFAVIYYDIGDDFNENNKLIVPYEKKDNVWKINVDLPVGVKRVRFDPQMIGNKYIFFDHIIINGKKLDYIEYNIFKLNDRSTLICQYPFIVFPFNKTELDITIQFENFSKEDISIFMNQIVEKNQKIDELVRKNEMLVNELDLQKNSQLFNKIKLKLKQILNKFNSLILKIKGRIHYEKNK